MFGYKFQDAREPNARSSTTWESNDMQQKIEDEQRTTDDNKGEKEDKDEEEDQEDQHRSVYLIDL